jgi:UDP-N-acetylglucosamine 2-epimerase (non-hydrolysing)
MRILLTIGTRPEAIKMAPLVRARQSRPEGIDVRVCLTGQHRDLLEQVLRVFSLPVHHDLKVMRPGQTIHDVTTSVLTGMRDVLDAERPDVLMVHGDTTTTFAAALAGFYAQVPVGHVEAGLRTGRRYEPFPEELNRVMADALSTHLYAATEGARRALLAEGRRDGDIHVTGNTVIDALLEVAARDYQFADPLLESLGQSRRLLLITAHRRESFGEPFERICAALREVVESNPDVEALYPVHPNPHVQHTVRQTLGDIPRLHLVEPLEYLPFVHLLKKSHLVITDSGGIQEEAPALHKPVVVMREVTERAEAVEAGAAFLAGTQTEDIVAQCQRLLHEPAAYASAAAAPSPFGDGLAASRIAAHLASLAQ